MPDPSPVWPARLDHLHIASDDPARLKDFYRDVLGLVPARLPDDTYLLQGRERRLVIGPGKPGGRPCHGFRVQDRDQLRAVREHLTGRGLTLERSPSAVFGPEAVAVRDPDGWLIVFGLPRPDLPALKAVNATVPRNYPARLQHAVVASPNLPAMMDFYENALGFVPSDYCYQEMDDPASKQAAFYRTDPEHHSFAVFGASSVRADHHAYEASCWNDIRDWADHLANLQEKVWWGPGRHGPGNNLFIMFKDPHGHPVEISAEMEVMAREMALRHWPLNERTLNQRGLGWLRD